VCCVVFCCKMVSLFMSLKVSHVTLCTRGVPLEARRRPGERRESTISLILLSFNIYFIYLFILITCLLDWWRYELGRQPASTKLSSNKTVRRIRVRGGNVKWRALRLDTGNYSWGSEAVTRKTRILDVVYNASNNELVRTQTLVKSAIVQVDAAPFKQWYLQHYGVDIGRKKKAVVKKETPEVLLYMLYQNNASFLFLLYLIFDFTLRMFAGCPWSLLTWFSQV